MAQLILPPKLLTFKVKSGSTTVVNTYSNPSSIYDGFPLQFQVDLYVDVQYHSSDLTPSAFIYDANDIVPGDWLGQPSNKTYRIVSIVSVTNSNELTAIIEDEDLYVLLNDISGAGFNYPDEEQYGYIFDLNQEGLPKITGTAPQAAQLPSSTYYTFDIDGRFKYRNFLTDYWELDKDDQSYSGVTVGDMVYINSSGKFVKIDSSNISTQLNYAFGMVTSVNTPNDGNILVRPFGRVVYDLPTLPGNIGDLLYFDPSSGTNNLTATIPTSNVFGVYIKIDNTTALLLQNHPSGGGGGTSGPSVTGVTITNTVLEIQNSDNTSVQVDLDPSTSSQSKEGVTTHGFLFLDETAFTGTTFDAVFTTSSITDNIQVYELDNSQLTAKLTYVVLDIGSLTTVSQNKVLVLPQLTGSFESKVIKFIMKRNELDDTMDVMIGSKWISGGASDRIIAANINTKLTNSGYFFPIEPLESVEILYDGYDWLVVNTQKQQYVQATPVNYLLYGTNGTAGSFKNRDISNLL